MKKQVVAVLGLGRFGSTLVEELANLDCQVIAIDKNHEHVDRVADIATTALVCDSTDQEALIEAGFKDVDHAVVAFGSDMHDTVLATVILKEIGVPYITVRVDDEKFNGIMRRLGATDIISPQKTAGRTLAMKVRTGAIVDYYRFMGDYCMAQIEVKRDFAETIEGMDVRNNYDINILLISRDGKSITPRGSDIIRAKDKVTVFGKTKAVAKITELFSGR